MVWFPGGQIVIPCNSRKATLPGGRAVMQCKMLSWAVMQCQIFEVVGNTMSIFLVVVVIEIGQRQWVSGMQRFQGRRGICGAVVRHQNRAAMPSPPYYIAEIPGDSRLGITFSSLSFATHMFTQ